MTYGQQSYTITVKNRERVEAEEMDFPNSRIYRMEYTYRFSTRYRLEDVKNEDIKHQRQEESNLCSIDTLVRMKGQKIPKIIINCQSEMKTEMDSKELKDRWSKAIFILRNEDATDKWF